jgi:hypothetical protein
MRNGTSFGQNGGGSQHAAEAAPASGAVMNAREIPYDYVATFNLEGRAGNRVQQVINISVDGAFVAVAIGYSFIPAKLPALPVVEVGSGSTLFSIPSNLNRTTRFVMSDLIQSVFDDPRLLVVCLARHMCGIDFKYSVVDSATGRELQNLAIHNIAGLGEPNGERPFRPFAKPVLFQPRSTIRIEIQEISEGTIYGYDDPVTHQRVTSELNFVLHGYKILGYGASGQ